MDFSSPGIFLNTLGSREYFFLIDTDGSAQRGAKRRQKKITSGHSSYESHFRANLGSYIYQTGLELMCMFVFIDADSWDLILRDYLQCMKK